MELSIGNKKKRDASRDTTEVFDNRHNDDSMEYSKEEIESTEKQIDSLLNKENCDAGINDSFRITQEKTDDTEFNKAIDDTGQPNEKNEIFTKDETWENNPDLNVKEKSLSEDVQPIDPSDQQNTKKGFSIPKIKIRINKDRLSTSRDYEVKKMIPVVTSKDSTITPNSEYYPQELSENNVEQHIPQDIIQTEKTNQKSTPSKIKKRWFTSNKDDAIQTKEQTNGKRLSLGFSKNKIPRTNESVEEEHMKNEETTIVSTNDISNYQPQEPLIDEDVRKLLRITDELLGKLPEEVIEEFATSDDFVLYQKIMNKFQIK